MVAYAGIGSRQTPADIIDIMRLSAIELAKQGYTCNTGACKGADQAFANGALQGYGQVQLFVPWPSYEQGWISTLHGKVDVHVFQTNDQEAINSVHQFHPAAGKLKQSVMKLHARNFCILRSVSFVICWTPNGSAQGGTGQAIRIAQANNIPVYDLGIIDTLAAFKQRLGLANA
jgi:hypothetical protein